MGAFTAIDTAHTGLAFNHRWTELVSHNVANSNTMTSPDGEPFRQWQLIGRVNADPQVAEGAGVQVAAVVEDTGQPALYTSPGHPLADDDGRVQGPVVDLAEQLTNLMIAQRGYQAGSRVVNSAREAYASALRIGER